MNTRNLRHLVVFAGLLPASFAFAQEEVEPNDARATATQAFGTAGTGLIAGDVLSGTTTGLSQTVPGIGSADYFLVKTAAAPLGIYRHRLALTTAGAAGHTATIRGVTTAGADTGLQFSSTATSPQRFNQWYGFGRNEEFYYRVDGAAATTSPYTSTYSVDPVTPIATSVSIVVGPVTISTINSATTIDTDFWVYDANFNPVPTFGNDDNTLAGGGTDVGTTSIATRSLAAGTYYLAIGRYNLANNQPSPSDERFADPYIDAANITVGSSTTTTAGNSNVRIAGADGTSIALNVPVAAAYDVSSVQFVVVPTPSLFGAGAVSPTAVQRPPTLPNRSSTTVLSVQVNPAADPPSTGITVSANVDALIPGSTVALNDNGTNGDLVAGDNTFSAQFSAIATSPVGSSTIPFTVSDAQGRSFTGNTTLRVDTDVVPFGDITSTSIPTPATVDVAASQIAWASFVVPCEQSAGSPAAYFDITTLASGTLPDTHMGLYRADGSLVTVDDDDGPGAKSLLTYGTGSGEDIDGADTTAVANGRDGPMLAPGTYYLAVGEYQVTFGTTNFNVLATDVPSGSVSYRFITNLACTGNPTCDGIDFNNDGLFPADEDLIDFLVVLAGGTCSNDPNCNDIDFNNDGLFPSDDDLIAFLRVLAGGNCT